MQTVDGRKVYDDDPIAFINNIVTNDFYNVGKNESNEYIPGVQWGFYQVSAKCIERKITQNGVVKICLNKP